MKRLIVFLLFACACIAAALSVAAGGLASVGSYVATADPLRVVCLAAAALAFSAFLAGVITGDHSWVDRLWSTAPVAFAWYYAARGWGDWRTLAATLVITAWGARLTFNFARKGGYSGTEDYRWPILRTRITNPVAWQAFNLLFIAGFQVGLLVLMTVPVDALLRAEGRSTGAGDLWFLLLLGVSVALLCFETAADEQQWRFHQAKRSASQGAPAPERFRNDVQRGFLATGLFRHSRHPNYFAEIAQWWCLALATWCVSTGFPWYLVGAVVLSGLFAGSVSFTEGLSASKYPAYRTYQAKVSAVIPWFGTMEDAEEPVPVNSAAGGEQD